MSFKNLSHKFDKNYNDAIKNQNEINNTSRIQLISNTATYSKKQREIILTEDEYVIGTSWRENYSFFDLPDKYLNAIQPYAFLYTSQGYINEESWSFWQYCWWEQYTLGTETVSILRMRADGYIVIDSISNIAPVYVTAKIKILNPNLCIEIKKAKT